MFTNRGMIISKDGDIIGPDYFLTSNSSIRPSFFKGNLIIVDEKGSEITLDNYIEAYGSYFSYIESTENSGYLVPKLTQLTNPKTVSIHTNGDIIAYSTGLNDVVFPIASTTSLGTIKVGNNLTITEDGTLNAQAGGVSNWNDIQNKPSTLDGYGITDAAKQSDLTSHTGNSDIHVTYSEKAGWNAAQSVAHSHGNKK